MNTGINEAYINSLPSLHGKPKVSYDLNCFERFDTKRRHVTIKIAVRAINIVGKEQLPERLSVHVNAAGTIIILMDDAENGFAVKWMKGYRRFVGAADVVRFLIEKGVKIPVEAKLIYDGELGGWVARLPKENSEK